MQLLYNPAIALSMCTQKPVHKGSEPKRGNNPEVLKWVNGSTVEHPYHGIKREKLLIHTTWRTLQHIILSKKANPRRLYTVCSIYVTFLKWKQYRNGGQTSSCQAESEGESVWLHKGGRKDLVWKRCVLTVSMSVSWLTQQHLLERRSPTFLAPGTGLWKTVFPWRGWGGWGVVQAVTREMGSGRRSFARTPAAHLLLCGPVPNRLRTGIGLGPQKLGTPAL